MFYTLKIFYIDYLENPKKEYKVFNLGLSKKEKDIFKNFKLPRRLAKIYK